MKDMEFDFNGVSIIDMSVGDIFLKEGEILAVAAPRKGLPAWQVTYDTGEGPRMIFAAGVPIIVNAKALPVLVGDDEIVEAEE